jgi:hypothetical protein
VLGHWILSALPPYHTILTLRGVLPGILSTNRQAGAPEPVPQPPEGHPHRSGQPRAAGGVGAVGDRHSLSEPAQAPGRVALRADDVAHAGTLSFCMCSWCRLCTVVLVVGWMYTQLRKLSDIQCWCQLRKRMTYCVISPLLGSLSACYFAHCLTA